MTLPSKIPKWDNKKLEQLIWQGILNTLELHVTLLAKKLTKQPTMMAHLENLIKFGDEMIS